MVKSSTKIVRQELWRRGNLSWQLRASQRPVYDYIKAQTSRDVVCAMHRGLGKSYLGVLLCLEQAMQGRHAVYAGPSAAAVERIAHPLVNVITKDAPPNFPKIRKGTTRFPSGGTLTFIGADDAARGLNCGFVVFDEESFCEDPDYFISSVIFPRLVQDKGTLVHISTPPLTPEHPYAKRLQKAKAEGCAFISTLDDNPDITAEQKSEIERILGGRQTTEFRREMLCQILTEEKLAVFPGLPEAAPVVEEDKSVPALIGLCIKPSGLSAAVALSENGTVLHCAEHEGVLERLAETLDEWRKEAKTPPLLVGRVPPKVGEYLLRHLSLFVLEPVGTLHTDVDSLGLLFKKEALKFAAFRPWENARNAIWNKGRTDFDKSGKGFALTQALAAAATKLAEARGDDLDTFMAWATRASLEANIPTVRDALRG